MKPVHFRREDLPKPGCATCINLIVTRPTQINSENFDWAGVNANACSLHEFEIVPMGYMPSYEAQNMICNDWEACR